MKQKFLFLMTLGIALSFFSCESTDSSASNTNFDRKAMLTNLIDNRIIPAFEQLNTEVNDLKTKTDNFNNNPTESSLLELQTAWEKAYLTWQSCNTFNFGPAGEEGIKKSLVEEVGTFPISTTKLENYLLNGDITFNNFDRDTRGFLALEYLIFDKNGSNTNVLSRFQGTNAEKYKAYLKAVADNLQTQINKVNTDWKTYKSTFINNDGTSAGSSTAVLFNEFVKSYEAAKNFKVGLPAGKRPGQTQAEAAKVEAYYSGKSVKFLKAHLESINAIWEGKTWKGEEGIGFEEYLKTIEGGEALTNSTKMQYALIMSELNKFTGTESLEARILRNAPEVNTLYEEMQKHTRFYKSDMSSLLGISITYNSGDGD